MKTSLAGLVATALFAAGAILPAAAAGKLTQVRMSVDEDPITVRLAKSLGYLEQEGKIYLIDPSAVRIVEEGVELANGMGFSRDGRIFYFADSALRRIYSYRVDDRSGQLSERKTFAQLKSEDGLPDGLTVDAEDHLWAAFWYGGKVMRLDPDGKVQRVIEVPAIQTSSVAFGGTEIDELFIATAAEAWPSDLAPPTYRADEPNQGGGLYRIRPGVRGKGEYLAEL